MGASFVGALSSKKHYWVAAQTRPGNLLPEQVRAAARFNKAPSKFCFIPKTE
jgi:hypothetical protein